MMESAPTTEAVYQGVYALYNNSNVAEQEKASKWLEQLQNSVGVSSIPLFHSWENVGFRKILPVMWFAWIFFKQNIEHNHTFATY